MALDLELARILCNQMRSIGYPNISTVPISLPQVPTYCSIVVDRLGAYLDPSFQKNLDPPLFWLYRLKDMQVLMELHALTEDHALSLLQKKHDAYGSKPLLLTKDVGIAVRLIDKLCRMEHLLTHPGIDPGRESLLDTQLDAFNYAVLGNLMVRGGIS